MKVNAQECGAGVQDMLSTHEALKQVQTAARRRNTTKENVRYRIGNLESRVWANRAD